MCKAHHYLSMDQQETRMETTQKWLFKYKWQLLLSSLFSVASTVLWVYFAMMMSRLVDSIAANDREVYLKFALMSVLYVAAVRLLSYFYKRLLSRYSNRTVQYMRDQFLAYDYARKGIPKPAEEISILTNDLQTVKQNLCDILPSILSSLVSIVLSSILLFRLNVAVTLVIYGIVILVLVLPALMKKVIEKKQMDITAKNAEFMNTLEDHFSGFDVAKSYGAAGAMLQKATDLSADLCQENESFETVSSRLEEVMHLLVTLLGTAGFIFGSYLVMIHAISYGNMVAIVQLTNTLATPLHQISDYISRLLGARAVLHKLQKRYLAEETEPDAMDPGFEKIHSIRLENVTFTIGSDCILDNVNYEFTAGNRYLLEGASGSGKTTLLRILSMAEDRYTGRVLINDTDIRTLNRDVVSRYVQYIEQTPYIFDASAKENICFYAKTEEEKLARITDQLHITYLMEKDTETGRLKATLSGGEKQRISLARGLYREKKVYLLDEISASLDPVNTRIVEQIIASIQCDIVISVSHKISEEDRRAYDTVLKIKDGTLVRVSG